MLPAVILFMILTLTIYMKGCRKQYQTSSNEFTTIEEMTETTVESPIQSEECIGQDCNSIRDLFQDAGFTSIHFEEIEDIKSSDTEKLYAIESVSIGGEENFSKGQTFENTDEVLIFYHTYAECNITIHVEFIPNPFFSKYDVNLLLDDEEQGEIPHGDSADFELALKPGDYTLTFESDEHSYVRENVSLSVDCDMDISYEISCNKENISIKTLYVDKLTELNEGEVKLDVSSSDYKYENYTKVEKALKKLGFTNIKYSVLYDIVLGWTAAGEVESVSIDKNKDFKRGDVFASDSEIIITYHMKEEDDPNKPAKPTTESPDTTTEEQDVSKPVFYSTNNYETAKKGNTGVFAYRDRGSSYDIYWIIDFDEGYVYYFTDGNGESFCERLKIESGTLNDKIIITYHDGGDKWSYRLHFKYVNHPETLIMNDQNGFDWEYSTTALNDALNLKKTKPLKTIKEYLLHISLVQQIDEKSITKPKQTQALELCLFWLLLFQLFSLKYFLLFSFIVMEFNKNRRICRIVHIKVKVFLIIHPEIFNVWTLYTEEFITHIIYCIYFYLIKPKFIYFVNNITWGHLCIILRNG